MNNNTAVANPFNYSNSNNQTQDTSQSKKFIDILQVFVLIAAVIVVLYLFFIIPTQVDGLSMSPTFDNDQILLSNRFLQLAGGEQGFLPNYDYQRGDIVVFTRPNQADLIKRIIALEGETVRLENERVYVNGQLLQENYIDHELKPTITGDFMPEGVEKQVPPGHYFALGDNRTNSIDSRSSAVGFIKRDQLRGAPFISIIPEFYLISRPEYNL